MVRAIGWCGGSGEGVGVRALGLHSMRASSCRRQTNVYYCAGRILVPALMDTFICQAFHKRVRRKGGWRAWAEG